MGEGAITSLGLKTRSLSGNLAGLGVVFQDCPLIPWLVSFLVWFSPEAIIALSDSAL